MNNLGLPTKIQLYIRLFVSWTVENRRTDRNTIYKLCESVALAILLDIADMLFGANVNQTRIPVCEAQLAIEAQFFQQAFLTCKVGQSNQVRFLV